MISQKTRFQTFMFPRARAYVCSFAARARVMDTSTFCTQVTKHRTIIWPFENEPVHSPKKADGGSTILLYAWRKMLTEKIHS